LNYAHFVYYALVAVSGDPALDSSWEKLKFEADQAVSLGNFAKASGLWQQALEQLDYVEDRDPRVALTLDQLAESLCQLGKRAQAVPIRQHLVMIRENVNGKDHIEVANSLNSLAELYYSMGKFPEAQPLSERIMDIYEKIFGSEHLGLAMIATFLAYIYHGQGNYEKAEIFYDRAISIKQKVLGYNHNETGLLMENYSALLHATNRAEEAEQVYANVGTASGLWRLVAAQATEQATKGKTGLKESGLWQTRGKKQP
jgi:tetratricopeptide (TPR) repeat protein